MNQMTQTAPYPTILAELVGRLRYRDVGDGWMQVAVGREPE